MLHCLSSTCKRMRYFVSPFEIPDFLKAKRMMIIREHNSHCLSFISLSQVTFILAKIFCLILLCESFKNKRFWRKNFSIPVSFGCFTSNFKIIKLLKKVFQKFKKNSIRHLNQNFNNNNSNFKTFQLVEFIFHWL